MKRLIAALASLLLLSACAETELASHYAKKMFPEPPPVPGKSPIQQGTFKIGKPYKVQGKTYYPQESYDLVETGIASWYGKEFHGKKTANGERFDMNELTAAHRTLQMPSLVRVTNLENGRSVIVRVNDRGPYKRSRVMDVSAKTADLLGFKIKGTAKVRLEVLPQESLRIAQIARTGANTRGYENAFNGPGARQPLPAEYPRGGYQVASAPVAGPAVAAYPLPSVSREVLYTPRTEGQGAPYQTAMPGHAVDGAFYPDPVVTETPVRPSYIFVQAGSFSQYDNAKRLSESLSRFAAAEVQPVVAGGRQLYRVRLGPVNTVEKADILLARVVDSGNSDAMIVVD